MQKIIELLEIKKSELFFYCSFNFLRNLDKNKLIEDYLINPLVKNIQSGIIKICEVEIVGESHFFLVKKLDWDTKYFGFPVFRIELILYNHTYISILNKAITEFIKLYTKDNEYYMINIPCEDFRLTQAFCSTKFRLVETRLNYYSSNIQKYNSPRYPVRLATDEDSDDLRKVAIKMRNPYDRVHADPVFSNLVADNYLGDFIVESIKGFADIVIVPDGITEKPFGFLAGNLPENILGINVSKLVLAAIDNSIEEGWLDKLLSEMIYRVKGSNADYLTTITQITNRSAIHVWEKAGFKLANTSYLFTYKNI